MHLVVCRQLRDLMTNILGKKHATNNRGMALETTKGHLQSAEIA